MDDNWISAGVELSEASGYVHDIGKASERFATKLRSNGPIEADEVRHEWLSMKLLQALRRNGWDWSAAWKRLGSGLLDVTLGDRKVGSAKPLCVENAVEAVDLLVATHHGLFQCQPGSKAPTPMCPTARERHVRSERPGTAQLSPCGHIGTEVWAAYAAAETALRETTSNRVGSLEFWRALTLLSRAALIAADHSVSRCRMPERGGGSGVYANTALFDGRRELNQLLDWHLLNVGQRAGQLFRRFADCILPAANPALPGLVGSVRTKVLATASSQGRFEWQNVCGDALQRARAVHPEAPCLVFSLAGTGTGKTRMNLRAACALSRDANPRVSIALNLRSLTLQTGRALRAGLGLTAQELAVVIGDGVTRALFERATPVDDDENPDEGEIQVDGQSIAPPDWLLQLTTRPSEQSLLMTPVLVSTIDFLVAAGEPATQGHHVKALMRVLSGELVLDEVDSYEPEPLVAVLRIVQLAALAGRNVICSSATLSEPTALAVHEAFQSGIGLREALLGTAVGYQCAAIDDRMAPSVQQFTVAGSREFAGWYANRLVALRGSLATAPVYRLAALQPVSEMSIRGWNQAVVAGVTQLHNAHAWRFGDSGKRVSFGLVRVANIGTAVDTARHLASTLRHAWIACYHAGEFLIARFHKERRLDALLVRSAGDQHILDDQEIQNLVARSESESVPFIVVATPVEEIGRDHDFDWAVLDASSTQSLVQAGGRVNRHRLRPCDGRPNILVLQFNWRHCRNQGRLDKPAFAWPGYEEASKPGRTADYGSHDLADLLPWAEAQQVISARVRFDPDCHFASADDAAIARRVRPFFGDRGAFASNKPHSWLLTQGAGSPYAYTQLRAQSGKQETWLITNAATPTFARRVRVASRGVVEDRCLPDQLITAPAAANAWLTCDPIAMERLCAEFGVDAGHGMVAQLTKYGDGERFVYDLGFGVRRTA